MNEQKIKNYSSDIVNFINSDAETAKISENGITHLILFKQQDCRHHKNAYYIYTILLRRYYCAPNSYTTICDKLTEVKSRSENIATSSNNVTEGAFLYIHDNIVYILKSESQLDDKSKLFDTVELTEKLSNSQYIVRDKNWYDSTLAIKLADYLFDELSVKLLHRLYMLEPRVSTLRYKSVGKDNPDIGAYAKLSIAGNIAFATNPNKDLVCDNKYRLLERLNYAKYITTHFAKMIINDNNTELAFNQYINDITQYRETSLSKSSSCIAEANNKLDNYLSGEYDNIGDSRIYHLDTLESNIRNIISGATRANSIDVNNEFLLAHQYDTLRYMNFNEYIRVTAFIQNINALQQTTLKIKISINNAAFLKRINCDGDNINEIKIKYQCNIYDDLDWDDRSKSYPPNICEPDSYVIKCSLKSIINIVNNHYDDIIMGVFSISVLDLKNNEILKYSK